MQSTVPWWLWVYSLITIINNGKFLENLPFKLCKKYTACN